MRETEFSLLEIGVGGYADPLAGGASLRSWKEYFPKALISGLDYFDKSSHEEEKIKIFKGSQADPMVIADILAHNKNGFKVIIDDGSHRSEHIISSLYMLWNYVQPDGWYIIEDLQTSYWPLYGGSLHDRNAPQTSVGFLKSLIDNLNWQEIHQPGYSPTEFDKTLKGMHLYHNMVFLQKGDNVEGSNTLRDNVLYKV